MIYGYARVSTKEQNLDRQLEALRKVVLDERNIITDKQSGATFDRKGYNTLVGTDLTAPMLREGDTLVIVSLDRLGRDYKEIQRHWQHITQILKADIRDEKYTLVKTICMYDIIIIIPSVVLGVWRFNEIFYPFRLIMWGYLIYGLSSKYPNYRFVINLSSIIIFISWLIFRIHSTCQDAGYMPYIFNWFGLF